MEGVAGLNIGKDNPIGVTRNGRCDALEYHTFLVERCLQVERTVDDAGAEGAFLSHADDVLVTHGEGEMLLVGLFRAVDERYFGFVDAELVT